MIADEKYDFKSQTKTKLFILGAVGLLFLIVGIFMAKNSGGHEEHHASTEISKTLTASVAPQEADHQMAAAEEHHGSPVWLKRVYAAVWHNNIFFIGLGIIGLFFVAIQYAAQAGWSAPIKRIPLAMGSWILVGGIIMILVWFVAKSDIFHWTHADLFDKSSKSYDPIIDGKGGFFYWPLQHGGFPIFFFLRMVLFFGLWYLFFAWIKKEMLAEDLNGGSTHWFKARKFSAIFLVIFAVSSSIAAWDWVMSIDTHWYSTMFGWYVFASWWVTGLTAITLIVIYLKDAGYLKVVNANHLHDLGKFIFAFSIFWTYIWFGQFLLIYYANIPEETIYFINQMHTAPYNWIFYANLFLNFVFPFLLLMTRDSKRHESMLKVVCFIVIIGHWFDFYNMVTPGVMKLEGGMGFLEIGMGLIFTVVFLFVVLSALSKMQLVAKHHPFMEESLHYHI
ncbi:MAG: quinol:cytochrome C oxidoreductase [Bacteroidetes bacterium]|nr:quinol:cytochrome C oxidoreductase [Bacteroidota bacterium]MBS1541152.1 quinol:cytochrome C oxidoreductase [Bacteroidota bacterium]